MPVYEYKGVTAQGKKVSGVQDGDGLKSVRAKLKKDGIVVLEIQEGGALRAGRSREITFRRSKVRLRRPCELHASACHAPVRRVFR